jgi:hypothetical protein
MTVATTQDRISYSGNGVTTAFSFPYVFFDGTDLTVILVSSAGVETTQTITTEYTVSGGSVASGTVTMVTAPASGETLVIVREQPFTQTALDLEENDPLPSAILEEAIDRTVILAQQNNGQLARAAKLSPGDTSGFDPTLPSTHTANTALVVNSAGDGWAVGPSTTDITSAAANATAAAASAAAASTSEGNAATSETNAANSAASAAASAQGFASVVLLTAASNDVEVADARTYYQVDASSNTVAINLPAIGAEDGLSYTIEVLDVSNAITLVRDGTDTINGVAGNYTGLVEAGQVIQIIADDGTPDNWIVVQSSALKVDDSTVELNGRTIRVKDDGIDPTKAKAGRNAQTGTSYTLALTDNLKLVTMSNASANTLTIPTNASVAFTADETRIDVAMLGAGVTTITGDTGVTVNGVSAGSVALEQYKGASLIKIGTDEWLCITSGTVA